MRRLQLLTSSLAMVFMFSINAFAAKYEVEIGGQAVQVETIGNVKVIDNNDPMHDFNYSNGELMNGGIIYETPESQNTTIRSIESFSFTINDKVTTNWETNYNSNWTVTTKAHLYDKKTGITYTSDDHKYVVSIMEDMETPIFQYEAKADDVKGGVKFTGVPTGTSLAIQVKNITKLPNSNTYLSGTGNTTYR